MDEAAQELVDRLRLLLVDDTSLSHPFWGVLLWL